ncbi:DUF1080 domain-containing protein [Aquiflexum sp. TKW24L]|uniref:family 16 glycoside hydrolase n=1 Tax=Aquiflexum sp. TKW24L TaxID=2942212 RepID=UPI0020BD4BED|nr:family 16 glycoside hydrolase [Aquiflexum sp. TKW24L]MCL6260935.1 DUF1080 domain-containing protein [Aquiflexum sp. TKW24L]
MTNTDFKKYTVLLGCVFLTGFFGNFALLAQQTVMLKDLSAFKPNKGTWQMASEVSGDPDQANFLKATQGEAILVNLPTKKNTGQDLVSIEEFGDIDLELEVMVASQSNSGVYLMGQYEIQILDSWTKKTPKPGDMGGVYERWDESKPDGQKGYEGYAPRQNVARAPGIWQQLRVSFQAPRFNAQGEKIENAKFLSIRLNGVLIHENLEMNGPTRGSLMPNDIAKGPLRIQGDHGAVAFRNIKITRFDTQAPTLTDLKYMTYKGFFNQEPDFSKLEVATVGIITNIQDPIPTPTGQNLTRYMGNLNIPENGEYVIQMLVSSGMGQLKIDGKKVIEMKEEFQRANVTLPKGTVPVEILVSKTKDWSDTGLELYVSGPGLREIALSKSVTRQMWSTDPILVDQQDVPMLRSFMDLPDGKRITHALSVSSTQQVHYSYDLSKGNLMQVWRGSFLDATPMWNDRGNGASVPLGAVVFIGNPDKNIQGIEFQSNNQNFDSQGYQTKNGGVEFSYDLQGISFKDFIISRADGKGLDRTLSPTGGTANKQYAIAEGAEIKLIKDGLYWVADKGFYIQVDPKSANKPVVQSSGGKQQLLVSINSQIQYAILF